MITVAGAALFCGAFLLGSIPTAYLLVRYRAGTDIRTQFSGNVGATNAGRVLGRSAFTVVFLLDAAKGAIPVWLGLTLGFDTPLIAWTPFFAVIGHCYTPWLGFNGGKGIATTAGGIAVIEPTAVALGLVVWIGFGIALRISSIASLLSLVTLMTAVVGWGSPVSASPVLATSMVVLWRHRENIIRLIRGEEHRL